MNYKENVPTERLTQVLSVGEGGRRLRKDDRYEIEVGGESFKTMGMNLLLRKGVYSYE